MREERRTSWRRLPGATLEIVRPSAEGATDEITTLFINHNHKIRGRIYIRPRLSDVLENSFKVAIKNHPHIMCKFLPDPIHGLVQNYSVFLFDMAQDLGTKILSPEVQRVLLKHAANFPMINKTEEEVPGIVIANRALFITSIPTGDEKDLTELLAFGRELTAEIHTAIEEAEKREAAQNELAGNETTGSGGADPLLSI